MKRILIVDDDVAVTNYFRVFLMQSEQFDPTVVNDSREVEGILAREPFDVIMLDMDMPHVSGLDILSMMRRTGIDIPVIILTGVSDVDLAVNAMKLGAFDYLIKPIDDEKLLEVLENGIRHRALTKTIDELPTQLSRSDLAHEAAFTQMPTQNPKMIRLLHQAERIAGSNLGIFLWGEPGTGKETLARAIHQASPRADMPFIAVEVDGQDPECFPAFFFGQTREWKGAREETSGIIEEANGGTVFLNNIDALTLPMQVRLQRVLQTGEYYRESSTRIQRVDVRMIVSSTHDLTLPEFSGIFSRDLLYHLMVNSIMIPPLRDRADDIPLLAMHFLKEEASSLNRNVTGISPEALELLAGYSFPDNVQELRTIIAGAVAVADGETISVSSLPSYIREKIALEKAGVPAGFQPKRLEDVIREHALRTLDLFGRDEVRAAEALGVTLDELRRITETR